MSAPATVPPRRGAASGRLERALLPGLLLAIGALFFWQRVPPFVSGDEAELSTLARGFLRPSGPLLSLPSTPMVVVRLLGRPIPLLTDPVAPPLTVYTRIPFLAFGRDALQALKAHNVAWGVVLVWSTFLFALALSEDLLLALVCAAVLPTLPVVLDTVMRGASFGLAAAALSVASWAFLIRATRGGSKTDWFASCFLIGLALSAGQHAAACLVGWLAGLGVAAGRLRRFFEPHPRRTAIASASLLVLGALPPLLGNVIGGWPTFTALWPLLGGPPKEVDQVARLKGFTLAAHRGFLSTLVERLGRVPAILPPPLIALSAGEGLGLAWTRSAWPLAAPPLFFACALLCSVLAPFQAYNHHLLVLAPLALGAGAALPASWPARRSPLRALVLVLAAATIASDLRMPRTQPTRSEVEVAAWLSRQPPRPTLANGMVVGVVRFLNFDRGRPESVIPFGQALSTGWRSALRPPCYFVIPTHADPLPLWLSMLRGITRSRGRPLREVARFGDPAQGRSYAVYAWDTR